MIREKLGMDDKDLEIFAMFMENPLVSQNEIAQRLKMSQPSVFVRVHKLRNKGILCHSAGINFSMCNILLCRVDLTSRSPETLLENMKNCPFFVNGFIVSGKNNVMLILAHESLKKIDDIVNTHLRPLDSVSNIHVDVVVNSARDYVFQINLAQEIAPDEACSGVGKCRQCTQLKMESHKPED